MCIYFLYMSKLIYNKWILSYGSKVLPSGPTATLNSAIWMDLFWRFNCSELDFMGYIFEVYFVHSLFHKRVSPRNYQAHEDLDKTSLIGLNKSLRDSYHWM